MAAQWHDKPFPLYNDISPLVEGWRATGNHVIRIHGVINRGSWRESPPWTFSSLPPESQPQTASDGGDNADGNGEDGNRDEDQQVHYMYCFDWNPLMFMLG